MKMETVMERKSEALASLPARERRRLEKQAERRGVPIFALRLISQRRWAALDNETTFRYRRD